MKTFTLIKWDENYDRVAYGFINNDNNIVRYRNAEDINAYAVFGERQLDVDHFEIDLNSYEVYNLNDEPINNIEIDFSEE